MYKVFYDQNQENVICVTTLGEVRELTGATAEQIKKLFVSKVISINGFTVANYTH